MECRHGWLTLAFSSASSCSLVPFLSVYLRLLHPRQGRRPLPPILSGLIVLPLFIQAFMAASSSHKPILSPGDGFLPQLSQLFIINADPHHIFLTLGRWFSHWASLLTHHITNQCGALFHKNTHALTQSGNLMSPYYTADLQAAKMLHSFLMRRRTTSWLFQGIFVGKKMLLAVLWVNCVTFPCQLSDNCNVTDAKCSQSETCWSVWVKHILGRVSQSVLITSHEFLETEAVWGEQTDIRFQSHQERERERESARKKKNGLSP